MSNSKRIDLILDSFSNNSERLLDIFWAIQEAFHHVPPSCIDTIAKRLNKTCAEINETLSFYHFFKAQPCGKNHIYLNDGVLARWAGFSDIKAAFERETGCLFDANPDENALFSLATTGCIGMCDQEPAALINGEVFPRLTAQDIEMIIPALVDGQSAPQIAAQMKQARASKDSKMINVETDVTLGDARASKISGSLVESRIRRRGAVFFGPYHFGQSLQLLPTLSRDQIIDEITESGLRGMGGAGFPTGIKWRMAAQADANERTVICNADEGEPGTFKDRVLLSERTGMLIEGLIIAGYAIGARHGIIYLRAEYRYIIPRIRQMISEAFAAGYLGQNCLGIKGFHFEIRVQLGAGAYVCGEESALIESLEGKRGEPRIKPPFPVTQGFRNKPTVVNNVETLAAVAQIICHGARWYRRYGTKLSPGTKLLSVSGDCRYPGVYEIEWGMRIAEFCAMVGTDDAIALQVSGPSGQCLAIDRAQDRRLCSEDLGCGGAMIVYGKKRDLLDAIRHYSHFFSKESCGICAPCRTGTPLLAMQMDKLCQGNASKKDVDDLRQWAKIVESSSRCGLGQMSGHAILTSYHDFPELYEQRISKSATEREETTGLHTFDVEAATFAYRKTVTHTPSSKQ